MATVQVVAVFDGALQAYARPFTVPAIGVAMRSFMDEVSKEDSDLAKHPGDYELHHLAMFEEETGRFIPLNPASDTVCILRAMDCVKRE